MKRLTDKRLAIPPGQWQEVTDEQRMELQEIPVPSMRELYYRLSQIEDILGDEYDLDRLRELAEADREGRCVVLPCKDWLDLVFGEQEVFWAVDDDYDDEKIREITVRNEERFTWFDGWKTVVFNGTDENGLDYEFSPEDVGKTVFTTREEAEAALAKGST